MSFMQRLIRHLACLSIIVFSISCTKPGSWGYNTGYAPDQPLPFSHKLHSGEYKVACVYCHTQVEYAKHSAVPSLNICMNCHMMVATDKEPIKKLQQKYFDGETVNWVKVHMLPDHVKFNHKRHVQFLSGPDDRYQACKNCHGEVSNMDVVAQVNSLGMGWCLNCHRSSMKGEVKAVPAHLQNYTPRGLQNCSTCHN